MNSVKHLTSTVVTSAALWSFFKLYLTINTTQMDKGKCAKCKDSKERETDNNYYKAICHEIFCYVYGKEKQTIFRCTFFIGTWCHDNIHYIIAIISYNLYNIVAIEPSTSLCDASISFIVLQFNASFHL